MIFNHLVVLSTCPDEPTAQRIARALVEERLAACVNRTLVESLFRWEGRVSAEPEQLLVIKTTAARYEALELRLRELHPYKVPEIIALPVVGGAQPYLDWVGEECRTGEKEGS